MKHIALIAALSAVAFPAAAQQGIIVPYGGSVYGGPPAGYSFQYQNNSGNDIVRQQLERFQQPEPSRSGTTCTTYGRQTFCN